jgi:hypothetical protein
MTDLVVTALYGTAIIITLLATVVTSGKHVFTIYGEHNNMYLLDPCTPSSLTERPML